MADMTKSGQSGATSKVVLTEYIVLVRVPASADNNEGQPLPPGTQLWMPVLNERAEHGKDGQVRVFKAIGRDAAVRAYRHDVPKGEEPRWGTFKAVSVTAWKGADTFAPKVGEDRQRDMGL